jgi:lysophospholipase L1-like esterase
MILQFVSYVIVFGSVLVPCLAQAAAHISPPDVVSYAALGDSYATGAGAGSPRLPPPFDISCGRFSDAYPVQVANSTLLDIEEYRFQNLACGGASTTSVLQGQVPQIGDSQVVTLTVGGNEVDFFAVLNECIYKWRPFSTCEKEWQRSRSLIESGKFIDDFNKLVKGAVQVLEPGSRLLVTGYAKFFNQHTDHCNHITFSKNDPDNLLTRSLRTKLNDLINRLNDVIEAAAEAHGVEYVDIDGVFEGHRFCEDGVPEPAPDRVETWFFSMRSAKHSGTGNRDHQHDTTQQIFPNPIKDFFDFARVFHPTSPGHTAIKDAILGHILEGR